MAKIEQEISDTQSAQNRLLVVIVAAVVLLLIGEVVLYRNIEHMKAMISETAMQFKEGKGVHPEPPAVSPTEKSGQGMMY